MPSRIKIAVLCGGQSAEHEVSILSAQNVIGALDRKKYSIFVIFITKKGQWFLFNSFKDFLSAKKPETLLKTQAQPVTLALGENYRSVIRLNAKLQRIRLDVIFPVLHGPNGEDGTVQGLLELSGIPFVGPGTLSSAMAMDKEITKRLATAAGIRTPRWLSFHRELQKEIRYELIERKLGLPFFIKPANMGSSVGIAKIKTKKQFLPAVKDAFKYDRKILFEECIVGRELECAVLGNERPQASPIAEIISTHEFYDYDAKYLDPNGAALKPGVKLPRKIEREIQTISLKVFKLLECQGMARIDFFMDKNNKIYFSEINTIPGFTNISMYPQLWIITGMNYSELLDKLIDFAFNK